MKRRTLVRKLGAAGIGATAISGAAAAERVAGASDADSITAQDCCAICCEEVLELPDCSCYVCDSEACTDGSV